MDIKNIIKDNTCYIVSNELKKEILAYINENKLLMDIHFFSLSQIIERVYFEYDDKTIYFIANHYNMSFSNAKVIIDNLKYLMYSEKINDSKIEYLSNIKNHLDENNLLKYDENFLDFLKRYNIICDLNPSNDFLYKINKLIDNKIEFLNVEETPSNNVYEFVNSEREIEYLANNISNLIQEGINPSMIHILNYNNAYYSYIDKIFTIYNIPYHLQSENFLFDIPYIKSIYNKFIMNEQIEINNNYLELHNQFIKLVNLVGFIEDQDDRNKYLLYLLKNKKVSSNIYKNCINFSNYETLYLDNHYYFFIGLNNKVFPIYKKDEDYISDELKDKLGYITSYKSNEITRKYCLNRLSYNKNIIISFRCSDYFNSYLRSDLVNRITENTLKETNINYFSKEYDALKLTRNLDAFYKYDEKSDELLELLTKIDKSRYKSYDNSYKPIDSAYYLENICKNKISISYSSFEKFNECHYKYYLSSIIKQREDTFTTYIGSLFHHVLEQIYDVEFDYNNAINTFKTDYELNDKDNILLENLLIDFKNKIDIILDQYSRGNYKHIKKEKKISIDVKTKVSISINGIIDKIMLDDHSHAYIVDYKTGNNKLTLEYLNDGLKCQLPFYFYLLNKSEEYANIFLVGCYLQLINFKIKAHDDTSKDMLLEGLTIDDAQLIEDIDTFYNEESFIKGIKPNQKGLGTYAKLFNSDDFKNIIKTMEMNIEKMIENVTNANFEICPKIIKKKETTCKFCNYGDICYKTFKDYIDIRKDNKNEVDE